MATTNLEIVRDDPDGPVSVGMCVDLEAARATAQYFANTEKTAFCIVSPSNGKIIERVTPSAAPKSRS